MCSVIINGGSCENVVSQELIQKLNLRTEFLGKKEKKKKKKKKRIEEHPHPYKLSWFEGQ